MSDLSETVELLQREIQQLKETQQVNDAQNEENLNSVKNSFFFKFMRFLTLGYVGKIEKLAIYF